MQTAAGIIVFMSPEVVIVIYYCRCYGWMDVTLEHVQNMFEIHLDRGWIVVRATVFHTFIKLA